MFCDREIVGELFVTMRSFNFNISDGATQFKKGKKGNSSNLSITKKHLKSFYLAAWLVRLHIDCAVFISHSRQLTSASLKYSNFWQSAPQTGFSCVMRKKRFPGASVGKNE